MKGFSVIKVIELYTKETTKSQPSYNESSMDPFKNSLLPRVRNNRFLQYRLNIFFCNHFTQPFVEQVNGTEWQLTINCNNLKEFFKKKIHRKMNCS